MKCFYHSADLDGHCSGAIVKRRYPECEMIGINYGDGFPWDSIESGETVFMVDFSLPIEDMVRLNDMCVLHWIDHHKSAVEAAHKIGFTAWGGHVLSDRAAGCELTWYHLYRDSPPPPDAVYLLGRYDVWDHDNAFVLPFQYGMRLVDDTWPDNTQLWDKLLGGERDTCLEYIDRGKLVMEYEAVENRKYARAYAFDSVLDGLRAVCVNRGMCNSKVFDAVYDPDKHDLMVTFCMKKDGTWRVSLYSDKAEVDCSAVAVNFGGGGHKGAAGFICAQLPFAD